MTSRLNTMTSAAERLNRSLDTTDRISDSVGAADFSGMENAINRVADQLDRMNQRQDEAANKAKKRRASFRNLLILFGTLLSFILHRQQENKSFNLPTA